MSKNLTQFFESHDRSYNDFEKEGLNLDDLMLKTKLAFVDGKYTFSSKSRYNLGEKNSSDHEYGLKVACPVQHNCPNPLLDFKHKKNGEVSATFDVSLPDQHDHIKLSKYLKVVYNHKKDKKDC